MGTLYLDRRDMALQHERRALVVFHEGRRQTSVPTALLERVVLMSNVEMDSGLLGFLAEEGVGVVVLSGRFHRNLAVMVGRPHNDTDRRMAQYRLFADPAWRLYWSRRLVAHKLASQSRLLRHGLGERPDRRYDLTKGLQTLSRLRARLGAECQWDLDQLRGVEGAGAAAYFGALTSLFADSLEFSGRNRRPPRDPVNAVLSLGYTLLHAEAVLAGHAAGLDPLLGFFHEPDYGRESLAADLVEPLRTRVDRLAWELFRGKTLRAEHFSRQGDACLLSKTGRGLFYPAYEIAVRPARRALRRFTVRLARALPEVKAPFEARSSR